MQNGSRYTAVWTTEESLFDSIQGQELLYLFSKPAVGPTKRPVQWLAATDFVHRWTVKRLMNTEFEWTWREVVVAWQHTVPAERQTHWRATSNVNTCPLALLIEVEGGAHPTDTFWHTVMLYPTRNGLHHFYVQIQQFVTCLSFLIDDILKMASLLCNTVPCLTQFTNYQNLGPAAFDLLSQFHAEQLPATPVLWHCTHGPATVQSMGYPIQALRHSTTCCLLHWCIVTDRHLFLGVQTLPPAPLPPLLVGQKCVLKHASQICTTLY